MPDGMSARPDFAEADNASVPAHHASLTIETPTASKPSRKRASRAQLPSPLLPSVHDLGVAYAAASKISMDCSEGCASSSARTTQARWTEQTFMPRAEALRSLITTLPAETLADVIVQLGILVTHVAVQVEDAADEAGARMKELGRIVDRVALSGIMVLARESGVDLNALDMWDMPCLHAARFAGMEGIQ